MSAIRGIDQLPPARTVTGPNGDDALVRLARLAFEGDPNSSNSANSAAGNGQRAVYPEDSVIGDWMRYARSTEESADCFLVGAIMPVCGAILGRGAWINWGSRRQFPNIFAMLAGKAGDRKSSGILAAARLAKQVLPSNAFLPASFSPETLFDEYDLLKGGRPDKLWIADDANPVLTDWRKSGNGERSATRFLSLYDCLGMAESFRRNQAEEGDSPRRTIDETSTSILFGATLNVAAFQSQATRAGMARRFLYYVADRHGRLIVRPGDIDGGEWKRVVAGFERMGQLGSGMDFAPDAEGLWAEYQQSNRSQLADLDPAQEAAASRLSSAPMQVLRVAMIFEAARIAHSGQPWSGRLRRDTLKLAIGHVDECLAAAEGMEALAQHATIAHDAEVLLARIRSHFPARGGFHVLTRSQITGRFCHDSHRFGAWKPDYVYHQLIPHLHRRNEARRIQGRAKGQPELYAFRAESWQDVPPAAEIEEIHRPTDAPPTATARQATEGGRQ